MEWGVCADCRRMIATGHTVHLTRSGQRVARAPEPGDIVVVKVGPNNIPVRAPLDVSDMDAEIIAGKMHGSVLHIHRGKRPPGGG